MVITYSYAYKSKEALISYLNIPSYIVVPLNKSKIDKKIYTNHIIAAVGLCLMHCTGHRFPFVICMYSSFYEQLQNKSVIRQGALNYYL